MTKKNKGIKKSNVIGWSIFIISIFIIIITVGLIFVIYFSEPKTSDQEAQINEVKTAGLYDSFQVGSLTFTLTNIQLDFYNRSRLNLSSTYWLFFKFNVIKTLSGVQNKTEK